MQQIQAKLSTQRWQGMVFGKYRGFTAPEILFLNPGYIRWLLEKEVPRVQNKYARQLMRQLDYVANRATRILPSEAPRQKFEFLLLADKKGVFAKALSVEKGSLPSELRDPFVIKKRCDTLNAFAFNDFKDPASGWKNMASSMRATLFPYLGSDPKAADFQRYIMNSSNFAPVRKTKGQNEV